jgi:YidC/Oxa1 family membrane protein insertase
MIWDSLLQGLGSILAFFYRLIPSYGVAIILLTILVRVVLLPLTIKQTRSMQAMQSVQPKVKELQRKYKGNRQKLNEEMMKLYKEHQVNPLGGCLPLLLQLPVFFALFSVLNTPVGAVALPGEGFSAESIPDDAVCLVEPGPSPQITIVCDRGDQRTFTAQSVVNKDTGQAITSDVSFLRSCRPAPADPDSGREEDGFLCNSLPGAEHVPRESDLFSAIVEDRATFLGMHLSCSPTQAASEDNIRVCAGPGTAAGVVPALPYFFMVALMIGTTFYQQKQMQKASAGPAAQQQQLMMRIMPVFLGFISISIAAGVLVYWVTTNAWQIGQQHLMLRKRVADATTVKGSVRRSDKPEGQSSDKPGSSGKAPKAVEGDGSKAKGSGGRSAGSRKKRRKR